MDYYCALRMACKPSPAKRLPGDRRRPDTRKRGRAVEGTGLENRQGFTPFVGSNPTASANTIPRMAQSLACLPLPDGFEPRGALAVEHDEESGKVYEMWMLDTALPFDAAVAALSAFAQRHFGGQKEKPPPSCRACAAGPRTGPWAARKSRRNSPARTQTARAICAMSIPTRRRIARPAGTPCPCPSGRHSGSSASGMTHSNSAHSG